MFCQSSVVALLFCIGHASLASGHFLWLNENLQGDAVVTFGETAGKPGPWTFLSMVADKVTVSSHDAAGPKNISLSVNKSFPHGLIHSELVGNIKSVPPFSLRLAATFGIFRGGSLLQYWCSADVVTKPNDWFQVQDWVPGAGLEITIRDPWMNHSDGTAMANVLVEHLKLMDPGDQCKPHMGPMQDGAACVVAVIRFNGQLMAGDLEVETFTAQGAKLNTTRSQTGVTILRVPYDMATEFTPVWARVNYHEKVAGTYNGTNYTFIDHWATTYARITRTSRPAMATTIV